MIRKIISSRTGKLISALVIALISVLSLQASPAHATGTGNQWAYHGNPYAYANAWNGGPFVKVWEGRTAHNDFTLSYNSYGGAWQLVYTGGGSWSGRCIGDAYNDPNNGYASLDNCGNDGTAIGQGTLFNISQPCGKGEYAFYNRHWGGYLEPANNYTNGTPWVVNAHTGAACLYFSAPG